MELCLGGRIWEIPSSSLCLLKHVSWKSHAQDMSFQGRRFQTPLFQNFGQDVHNQDKGSSFYVLQMNNESIWFSSFQYSADSDMLILIVIKIYQNDLNQIVTRRVI